MRARISAKGRESTTSPKTMRVEASVDQLKVTYFAPMEMVRVHAECSDYYGSGMRGGDIRRVDRDFWIDLTKAEVEHILAIALHGELLDGLESLKQIRVVTELKRQLDATQRELKLAQDKVEMLENRIAEARKALGES